MIRFFLLSLCLIYVPLYAHQWETCKKQTLNKMSQISGWCSEEKALIMMDLIKDNHCSKCIEIGVFAGKSLFPIVKALEFQGSGIAYGIDAWNTANATEGYNSEDPNYQWWKKLDFMTFYQSTKRLFGTLNQHCQLIKKSSQEAVHQFSDDSIDLVHFDGNHNAPYSFNDVLAYFPKVKDRGYIILNDPNWMSMMKPLVFLLERCDVLTPFSSNAQFMIFQKNKSKLNDALSLQLH